ncbi:TIGR02677 family protein [Enterococcus sp. BWT-B8]|uniref:TIGR02677 family protein n=1 Tax=Enterococcus sp. BWT-B8 TaxID=2885157 RepID=UPI001E3882E5|nr:TIGR02677 family protein [Enterococcus sp. BWT-B8]MCB5951109.1 TIGR02677 family protein [Enterococcus sp. BWT-B8]
MSANEKISAANYLTVDNVDRYRKIMSFFYQRHLQMNGLLYRLDILKMMQNEYDLSYSSQEIDQDLQNLVDWGNITKRQELIRPKSIEEYRNKHFRYQISETGILFEELLVKVSKLKESTRGELDKNRFVQLLDALTELKNISEGDGLELARTWEKVREIFMKIQKDTSDYIGYINSNEIDSQIKTESFLLYKDQFINYLREFIIKLQELYYKLRHSIEAIAPELQADIRLSLYEKEKRTPHLEAIDAEEIAERFNGELFALTTWFSGTKERESEYNSLMRQTEQMIAKMTGLIHYFGQELKQYRSRKKDYLQLANWFAAAETLDEGHQMFAAIFGLSHTRHIFVPEPSEATGSKDDSWQLSPAELVLGKRGRGGGGERKARSFKLKNKEQEKQLENYLTVEKKKEQRVSKYFKNGKIIFSELTDLDKDSRKIFLKWISQSIGDSQHLVNTELGFPVKITIHNDRRIKISSEDGVLEMPEVIIEKEGQ